MSAIANFTITGEASPGRVRAAGILDFVSALFIAMIVMPQPVVRQAIMGPDVTLLGIAVFVLVLIAGVLAMLWLYLAFSAVTWGRSPAMYLLDLGLDAPTKPTIGEAAGWATGWAVAAVPAICGLRGLYNGETGLPARFSGVPTRSTAVAAEE